MKLKQEILNLKKRGVKEIEINAIHLNIKQIIELKGMIKKRELIPDTLRLKMMFTDESIPHFLNGECIAPQCTYFIM